MMRETFKRRFAEIKRSYAAGLPAQADRLDALIGEHRTNPSAAQGIVDMVHQVGGTAGSFGLAEICIIASQLDRDFAHGVEVTARLNELAELSELLRAAAEL